MNSDELQQKADELWKAVMANREKYLQAWVAETGLKPSECELVQVQNEAGFRVFVQRREDRDQVEKLRAKLKWFEEREQRIERSHSWSAAGRALYERHNPKPE